ncbi:F-box only protein 28 [Sitophilus oryzae]|uniref:F-box only protein 28 n=1 Tax=Sitophilus oryzae TaxID=7048 RepID=A0A6J2XGL6_SITOR|nr:F-box only protein 28 [Sitophilus oryzae]
MYQSPMSYILLLPEVALENIFSFLNYDEIAKNRIVCRKFNEIGGKLLSRGFIQLEKRHATIYKRVKSALPRRESERKTHPLARHSDILQGVETRLSMLNMTYMRYIESKLICFIPGKVLDEIKSILDLVENDRSPPRTHQLLQELRDLSSMAMEHFDEQILPRCKQQIEQQTDVLYRDVVSTSKSTRLLFHQQFPHAISNELYKVKKLTKSHKHHIGYLTQNTQKLCLKMRKQKNILRIQSSKIHEQERKIQEQNQKIMEQESALNEIKKHVDDWDQKYKDLTTELIRARDEILLKASSSSGSLLSSPSLTSTPIQTGSFKSPTFKTNIKPRVAHILPKSYTLDFDRKRKGSNATEIPLKRNRSPSAVPDHQKYFQRSSKEKSVQNVELNIPNLENFEKKEQTYDAGPSEPNLEACTSSKNDSKSEYLTLFFDNLLSNPLKSAAKARKRKMTEDIDLK